MQRNDKEFNYMLCFLKLVQYVQTSSIPISFDGFRPSPYITAYLPKAEWGSGWELAQDIGRTRADMTRDPLQKWFVRS